MHYQYIPHLWLLIVSGMFSLALGIYAMLKHRTGKRAIYFILTMFTVTLWSIPNALEMSSTVFSTKLFWANVQYFSFCYLPVTLLALCMEFTGYDTWIKNKKIIWLAFIPTIIIVLVWTDGWHGFIRYDMYMDDSGAFPVIAKKYGYAFYLHALYSHGLNISAVFLLLRAVFFENTVYRKQAMALLIGVSMIVVPNVLFVLGFTPLGFDITPVFFGPGGFIITWGIFRYKFFDLVPLARATVIETMNAGVMVLDLQDRVVDMNPAFKRLVKISATNYNDRRVEDICAHIPELTQACKDRSIVHAEFKILVDQKEKIYEVLLSSLTDDKEKLIGRLAVIYEITEKKQAQQEFLKQQWKLAVSEEKERMARDMHDNLGQVLGFINLQTQGIRQELINAGVKSVSYKLDQLVEATQMAHNEIREYIRNVRSSVNSEQDFISVFKKYTQVYENQSGIKVHMNISEGFAEERLQPNLCLQILNILKEALNNVRKHAYAENVKISFHNTNKILGIIVEDDGKGFNPSGIYNNNKSGFGLDIMRERAIQIGGSIIIESELGKGCRIKVEVPKGEGELKNANEINAG